MSRLPPRHAVNYEGIDVLKFNQSSIRDIPPREVLLDQFVDLDQHECIGDERDNNSEEEEEEDDDQELFNPVTSMDYGLSAADLQKILDKQNKSLTKISKPPNVVACTMQLDGKQYIVTELSCCPFLRQFPLKAVKNDPINIGTAGNSIKAIFCGYAIIKDNIIAVTEKSFKPARQFQQLCPHSSILYTSLTMDLERYLMENDGDPSVGKQEVANIKAQLESVLCRPGILLSPEYEVKLCIFGSFATGFCSSNGSDVDLTLLTFLLGEDVEVNSAAVLEACKKELLQAGYTHMAQVLDARLPLLKFTDVRSRIEGDLSINNRLAVQNTELLRQYESMDPRVGKVCRLFKHWAKSFDLTSTIDGTLNSYGIVLMALYFLEYIGIVPNLQELYYRRAYMEMKRTAIQSEYPSEMIPNFEPRRVQNCDCSFATAPEYQPPEETRIWSLGQCFLALLHFYDNFNWNEFAISLRLGGFRRLVKKIPLLLEQKRDTKEPLYVEDPFDLSHNIGARATQSGFDRLKQALSHTVDLLSRGGSIKGIASLQPPVFAREHIKFLGNTRVAVCAPYAPEVESLVRYNTAPLAELIALASNSSSFIRARITSDLGHDGLIEFCVYSNAVRLYLPFSSACQWAFIEYLTPRDKRRGMCSNEYMLRKCVCRFWSSTRAGFIDVVRSGYPFTALTFLNYDTLVRLPKVLRSLTIQFAANYMHRDVGGVVIMGISDCSDVAITAQADAQTEANMLEWSGLEVDKLKTCSVESLLVAAGAAPDVHWPEAELSPESVLMDGDPMELIGITPATLLRLNVANTEKAAHVFLTPSQIRAGNPNPEALQNVLKKAGLSTVKQLCDRGFTTANFINLGVKAERVAHIPFTTEQWQSIGVQLGNYWLNICRETMISHGFPDPGTDVISIASLVAAGVNLAAIQRTRVKPSQSPIEWSQNEENMRKYKDEYNIQSERNMQHEMSRKTENEIHNIAMMHQNREGLKTMPYDQCKNWKEVSMYDNDHRVDPKALSLEESRAITEEYMDYPYYSVAPPPRKFLDDPKWIELMTERLWVPILNSQEYFSEFQVTPYLVPRMGCENVVYGLHEVLDHVSASSLQPPYQVLPCFETLESKDELLHLALGLHHFAQADFVIRHLLVVGSITNSLDELLSMDEKIVIDQFKSARHKIPTLIHSTLVRHALHTYRVLRDAVSKEGPVKLLSVPPILAARAAIFIVLMWKAGITLRGILRLMTILIQEQSNCDFYLTMEVTRESMDNHRITEDHVLCAARTLVRLAGDIHLPDKIIHVARRVPPQWLLPINYLAPGIEEVKNCMGQLKLLTWVAQIGCAKQAWYYMREAEHRSSVLRRAYNGEHDRTIEENSSFCCIVPRSLREHIYANWVTVPFCIALHRVALMGATALLDGKQCMFGPAATEQFWNHSPQLRELSNYCRQIPTYRIPSKVPCARKILEVLPHEAPGPVFVLTVDRVLRRGIETLEDVDNRLWFMQRLYARMNGLPKTRPFQLDEIHKLRSQHGDPVSVDLVTAIVRYSRFLWPDDLALLTVPPGPVSEIDILWLHNAFGPLSVDCVRELTTGVWRCNRINEGSIPRSIQSPNSFSPSQLYFLSKATEIAKKELQDEYNLINEQITNIEFYKFLISLGYSDIDEPYQTLINASKSKEIINDSDRLIISRVKIVSSLSEQQIIALAKLPLSIVENLLKKDIEFIIPALRLPNIAIFQLLRLNDEQASMILNFNNHEREKILALPITLIKDLLELYHDQRIPLLTLSPVELIVTFINLKGVSIIKHLPPVQIIRILSMGPPCFANFETNNISFLTTFLSLSSSAIELGLRLSPLEIRKLQQLPFEYIRPALELTESKCKEILSLTRIHAMKVLSLPTKEILNTKHTNDYNKLSYLDNQYFETPGTTEIDKFVNILLNASPEEVSNTLEMLRNTILSRVGSTKSLLLREFMIQDIPSQRIELALTLKKDLAISILTLPRDILHTALQLPLPYLLQVTDLPIATRTSVLLLPPPAILRLMALPAVQRDRILNTPPRLRLRILLLDAPKFHEKLKAIDSFTIDEPTELSEELRPYWRDLCGMATDKPIVEYVPHDLKSKCLLLSDFEIYIISSLPANLQSKYLNISLEHRLRCAELNFSQIVALLQIDANPSLLKLHEIGLLNELQIARPNGVVTSERAWLTLHSSKPHWERIHLALSEEANRCKDNQSQLSITGQRIIISNEIKERRFLKSAFSIDLPEKDEWTQEKHDSHGYVAIDFHELPKKATHYRLRRYHGLSIPQDHSILSRAQFHTLRSLPYHLASRKLGKQNLRLLNLTDSQLRELWNCLFQLDAESIREHNEPSILTLDQLCAIEVNVHDLIALAEVGSHVATNDLSLPLHLGIWEPELTQLHNVIDFIARRKLHDFGLRDHEIALIHRRPKVFQIMAFKKACRDLVAEAQNYNLPLTTNNLMYSSSISLESRLLSSGIGPVKILSVLSECITVGDQPNARDVLAAYFLEYLCQLQSGNLDPNQLSDVSGDIVAQLSTQALREGFPLTTENEPELIFYEPELDEYGNLIYNSNVYRQKTEEEQIKELTTKDVQRIPDWHFAYLTAKHIKFFTDEMISELSQDQLHWIPDEAIKALKPNSLLCIPKSAWSGATPSQIASLSLEQISNLHVDCIANFSGAALRAIKPSQMRVLTKLPKFSAEQLRWLLFDTCLLDTSSKGHIHVPRSRVLANIRRSVLQEMSLWPLPRGIPALLPPCVLKRVSFKQRDDFISGIFNTKSPPNEYQLRALQEDWVGDIESDEDDNNERISEDDIKWWESKFVDEPFPPPFEGITEDYSCNIEEPTTVHPCSLDSLRSRARRNSSTHLGNEITKDHTVLRDVNTEEDLEGISIYTIMKYYKVRAESSNNIYEPTDEQLKSLDIKRYHYRALGALERQKIRIMLGGDFHEARSQLLNSDSLEQIQEFCYSRERLDKLSSEGVKILVNHMNDVIIKKSNSVSPFWSGVIRDLTASTYVLNNSLIPIVRFERPEQVAQVLPARLRHHDISEEVLINHKFSDLIKVAFSWEELNNMDDRLLIKLEIPPNFLTEFNSIQMEREKNRIINVIGSTSVDEYPTGVSLCKAFRVALDLNELGYRHDTMSAYERRQFIKDPLTGKFLAKLQQELDNYQGLKRAMSEASLKYSPNTLALMKVTLRQLYDVDVSLDHLVSCGITIKQCFEAGLNINDLLYIPIPINQLVASGISCDALTLGLGSAAIPITKIQDARIPSVIFRDCGLDNAQREAFPGITSFLGLWSLPRLALQKIYLSEEQISRLTLKHLDLLAWSIPSLSVIPSDIILRLPNAGSIILTAQQVTYLLENNPNFFEINVTEEQLLRIPLDAEQVKRITLREDQLDLVKLSCLAKLGSVTVAEALQASDDVAAGGITALQPSHLISLGVTQYKLVSLGATISAVLDTIPESKTYSLKPEQCISLRLPIGSTFKDAINIPEANSIGVYAEQLEEMKLSTAQLAQLGITIRHLASVGISAADLAQQRLMGADATGVILNSAQVRGLGFTPDVLERIGHTLESIGTIGVSLEVLTALGVSSEELRDAGVSRHNLVTRDAIARVPTPAAEEAEPFQSVPMLLKVCLAVLGSDIKYSDDVKQVIRHNARSFSATAFDFLGSTPPLVQSIQQIRPSTARWIRELTASLIGNQLGIETMNIVSSIITVILAAKLSTAQAQAIVHIVSVLSRRKLIPLQTVIVVSSVAQLVSSGLNSEQIVVLCAVMLKIYSSVINMAESCAIRDEMEILVKKKVSSDLLSVLPDITTLILSDYDSIHNDSSYSESYKNTQYTDSVQKIKDNKVIGNISTDESDRKRKLIEEALFKVMQNIAQVNKSYNESKLQSALLNCTTYNCSSLVIKATLDSLIIDSKAKNPFWYHQDLLRRSISSMHDINLSHLALNLYITSIKETKCPFVWKGIELLVSLFIKNLWYWIESMTKNIKLLPCFVTDYTKILNLSLKHETENSTHKNISFTNAIHYFSALEAIHSVKENLEAQRLLSVFKKFQCIQSLVDYASQRENQEWTTAVDSALAEAQGTGDVLADYSVWLVLQTGPGIDYSNFSHDIREQLYSLYGLPETHWARNMTPQAAELLDNKIVDISMRTMLIKNVIDEFSEIMPDVPYRSCKFILYKNFHIFLDLTDMEKLLSYILNNYETPFVDMLKESCKASILAYKQDIQKTDGSELFSYYLSVNKSNEQINDLRHKDIDKKLKQNTIEILDNYQELDKKTLYHILYWLNICYEQNLDIPAIIDIISTAQGLLTAGISIKDGQIISDALHMLLETGAKSKDCVVVLTSLCKAVTNDVSSETIKAYIEYASKLAYNKVNIKTLKLTVLTMIDIIKSGATILHFKLLISIAHRFQAYNLSIKFLWFLVEIAAAVEEAKMHPKHLAIASAVVLRGYNHGTRASNPELVAVLLHNFQEARLECKNILFLTELGKAVLSGESESIHTYQIPLTKDMQKALYIEDNEIQELIDANLIRDCRE